MSDGGAIRFAEKMLALLDEGLFTVTYKYAVILGLLDLALEGVDRNGDPPRMVTTRELADKVIEIYWPHAVPFGHGDEADVLRQNAGRGDAQAEIVRWIQAFRNRMAAKHATGSLVQLRPLVAQEFSRLCDNVGWKLIQMPLPRVQIVGNTLDPFIYEIGWETNVALSDVRAYQHGRSSSFDNRIHLKPGVGDYLLQLNGLLRPLIHRHWAGMVARLNRMEEARLERFLFGSIRSALTAACDGLVQMQDGDCFYCLSALRGNVQVDHFIPWSRYPEDALANLVAAHDRCNSAKRDFLAATPHVSRWAERLGRRELKDMEAALNWEAGEDDIRRVARGIYLRLPADAVLWVGAREFTQPDLPALHHALA